MRVVSLAVVVDDDAAADAHATTLTAVADLLGNIQRQLARQPFIFSCNLHVTADDQEDSPHDDDTDADTDIRPAV